MENSEIFIDLISGNLDDDAERQLFSELSMNDDLRADYKCFTSVTDTINRHIDSFAPTSALKSRVYAKAGIALPSDFPPPAAVTAPKTAFLSSGLFKSIFTGAATLSATIIIMLLFFQPKNHITELANNSGITPNQSNGQYPMTNSFESNNGIAKPEVKEVIKYIYLKSKNEAKSSENKENNSEPVTFEANRYLSAETQLLSENNVIANNNLNHKELHYNIPSGNFPDFLTGLAASHLFDLELFSSASWNIPKDKINPLSFSKLNNMGFNILYGVSDDFRLGAELKQETFYTEYTGTEGNKTYQYFQQPNLTTISLVAKYYPYNISFLRTFARLGLGFNTAGFVIRPSLGLEYFANYNISMQLGIDYGYFNFMHQNQRFGTGKAGFLYGVSYHL